MFVRKLYYDLTTGEVLESHMRQGSVMMTTFEEDTAVLPTLNGRTEADTGCMVWTEPNAEIEMAFMMATNVSVDVTKTPHEVVFDYTPIEEPETPDPAVMEEALTKMGVELYEEG